jgi:methionyl-tRNA formyltransferase
VWKPCSAGCHTRYESLPSFPVLRVKLGHKHALWTTTPDGHPLRLLNIRLPSDSPHDSCLEPGTTIFQRSFPSPDGTTQRTGRLLIRCADGKWIDVRRIQPADKREMSVGDWWNGLKMAQGGLVLGAGTVGVS